MTPTAYLRWVERDTATACERDHGETHIKRFLQQWWIWPDGAFGLAFGEWRDVATEPELSLPPNKERR